MPPPLSSLGQPQAPELSLRRGRGSLKYAGNEFRVSNMPRGRLFMLAELRRFVLDRMHQEWAANGGRLHVSGRSLR
jgi:hypothetical protein